VAEENQEIEEVIDDQPADDKSGDDAGDVKDNPSDGTVLDDAGDKSSDDAKDDDHEPEKVAFTDDIRDQMANGDEKVRKILGRYTSLPAVARALVQAQTKIREGNKAPERPDPSDEKAMAKYRKEIGVPEDPSGYKLPEAVTSRITDEDKPALASFTEFAHAKGATQDVVDIATEWYAESQEAAAAAQLDIDNKGHQEAEDQLRSEWGPEYRGNLSMAKKMIAGIPGVGADWAGMKMADGTKLGNNPEFIKFMADMGRREFGDPVFADSDSESIHNSRKAEIEKVRDTEFEKYDNDPKMKAEYRAILEKEAKRAK